MMTHHRSNPRKKGAIVNYVERMIVLVNEELPGLDRPLSELYALLALTKGGSVTLEDVHDAWAMWRNRTNPTHKSLVLFDQLDLSVQELDREYMDGIHRAASRINLPDAAGVEG